LRMSMILQVDRRDSIGGRLSMAILAAVRTLSNRARDWARICQHCRQKS
jgi:hypothetical protein